MDTLYYLKEFQMVADQMDQKLLAERRLEAAVVTFGEDCVVLKLYKRSWANQSQDPLTAESRIFFSVWISDLAIKEQKLLYNIHALKLRKLKGYSIESRNFAAIFRESFKDFEPQWENVRVDYGPLTLMEGWLKIDSENLQEKLLKLVNQFFEIEHLIDGTLAHFK